MRVGSGQGFSLIEVLVAMALLAAVLIAIGGLFIIGGHQVKSGRTSSEALAVGREIHEDMVGWGYSQLWGMFGYDGQATTYTVDTRTSAPCATWQATLVSKLGPAAFANIEIDSLATVGGGLTNFQDASGTILAHAVRVNVTVNWEEVPGRIRSVTLGTTRN